MSRLLQTPGRFLCFAPTVLLLATLAGCGGGLDRASGKVTFGGKPVPAGKIYFMPDASKNNSGPSGYATIKDGAYDTSASGGMGVGKGPMVVAIEGYDPSTPATPEKGAPPPPPGEPPTFKSLFPRYETKADFAGGSVTKDFDVPADAATKKPAAGPVIP